MYVNSKHVYGWRNYKIEIISLMEKLVWALAFFPCLQRSAFEDGCVNQSRSDSAQDTRFINEKSFTEKCDGLCVWNCSIRYWENVFTCSSRQPQLKEEVTKNKMCKIIIVARIIEGKIFFLIFSRESRFQSESLLEGAYFRDNYI